MASPANEDAALFDQDTTEQLETNKFNDTLTQRQRAMMTKFIFSLSTRVTNPNIANMWNYALRYNPVDSVSNNLMVSALCRLSEEFNMPYEMDEFVEAIFAFLKDRKTELVYDDFAAIVKEFN